MALHKSVYSESNCAADDIITTTAASSANIGSEEIYSSGRIDIISNFAVRNLSSSSSSSLPSRDPKHFHYQYPETEHVTRNHYRSSETEEPLATDSDSDLNVLSVFWSKGMLGGAYYNAENSEVHIATDIVDVNPDFNILRSLFYLIQPTHLLVSAQVPESFLSTLKSLTKVSPLSNHSSTVESTSLERKLHILPKREYNFEACRRRVLLMKLPHEPVECDEDEHLRYLSSVIDMTNESMTHALGVLLKWLDVSWTFLNFEESKVSIMAVNTISLKNLVMIDRETYESLQIFSRQNHPSGFKRGVPGSCREGLSVYGIFNRCKSQLGCKFMRVMFLHPTRDIEVLNSRLDVVQFCVQPKHEDVVKNLLMCLKNIKSISRILSRLTKLSASIREWKSLHKTIYYSILIGNICEGHTSEARLFREITDCLTQELLETEYCISRIVDFKESEIQNTFIVKVGVDEELDKLKQDYGGIDTLMSGVAQEELDHLPSYIKQCSLVYIPEIGYLLAIPAWKKDMTDEDWDKTGINFMFKLGNVGHYKSERCKELDKVLGDTVVEIAQHESRILLKLVQFIQEKIEPLHRIIKYISELDCLIALSSVAKINNYQRPLLTHEQVLEIKGGRHPLQELCVDNFIPNDTFSGSNYGLMKIITGPNNSGKSIYLKQVALIAYLAHIGSFVPADNAKIGILEHIHTRIQTVESIATNKSAFMIDLKQMILSLYNSTPSSLIIVDEFGKGTTEIDGLSILASCVDQFLSRENKCPHVFLSTHFHNVVNLIQSSRYLRLQTMEYIADDDDHIVNLYKIKEGIINNSCALLVSESNLHGYRNVGVRAKEILEAMKTGKGHILPKGKQALKQDKFNIRAKNFF